MKAMGGSSPNRSASASVPHIRPPGGEFCSGADGRNTECNECHPVPELMGVGGNDGAGLPHVLVTSL